MADVRILDFELGIAQVKKSLEEMLPGKEVRFIGHDFDKGDFIYEVQLTEKQKKRLLFPEDFLEEEVLEERLALLKENEFAEYVQDCEGKTIRIYENGTFYDE